MTLNTILSTLSCIITITAVFLITIPLIECYYFFIAGCLIQMILFMRQKNWPLFTQMFVLLMFNFWGLYNWTNKGIG